MLIYNRAKVMDGGWPTSSLVAILVGPGYTPNADHDYVSDVVAHEVTGYGYARGFGASGRKPLAPTSVAVDDAADLARFTATGFEWPGLNVGTVKGMVLAKRGASDASSPLWAYFDGSPFPAVTNGGRLSIVWNAGGVFTLA